MNTKKYAAIVASTMLLSACLVPEKFNASIEVKPDLGYAFEYSGTVLNVIASAQLKKAGKFSAQEDSDLRAEEGRLKKSPEMRSVKYLGDGRYKIELQTTRKSGEPMQALNTFVVQPRRDGVLEITSTQLNDKEKQDLKEIGLVIDGKFQVSVPRNAEVIEHNADTTPFFGFGSYGWKIGKTDQRPVIKIRLKK